MFARALICYWTDVVDHMWLSEFFPVPSLTITRYEIWFSRLSRVHAWYIIYVSHHETEILHLETRIRRRARITKHHLFRLATDTPTGVTRMLRLFSFAPLLHAPCNTLVRSNNSGQTVIVSGGANTRAKSLPVTCWFHTCLSPETSNRLEGCVHVLCL